MSKILLILDGLWEDTNNNQLITQKLKHCTNFSKIIDDNCGYGKFDNKSDNLPVDSLTCISTLLGVKKEYIPKGRAYFEALASDIEIQDTDLILRTNIIAFKDELQIATNGYDLSSAELADFYKMASKKCTMDGNIKLYQTEGYKGIAIIPNAAKNLYKINTKSPYYNMGKKLADLLVIPQLDSLWTEIPVSCDYSANMQLIMLNLMLLESYDIYIDKKYKYAISAWGNGIKIKYPNFKEISNKKTAIICGTGIVKGIGKALKIDVLTDKSINGDTNTNLKYKAELAIKNINNYENIIVHINGLDESAHRKNLEEKLNFLEKIDAEFLGAILENMSDNDKIMITSDHGTNSETAKHTEDLQPFWIYQKSQKKQKNYEILSGISAIKILNDCEE